MLATAAPTAADYAHEGSQPQPINWTGCYVGINGGGAAPAANFTQRVDPGEPTSWSILRIWPQSTHLAPDRRHNDLGFIGGGQAGCNLQIGLFVAGIEGDWDYFRSTPSFNNPNGTRDRWRHRLR